MIEVKYLKREETGEAKLNTALREATEQLRGYRSGAHLVASHPGTGVALVFHGWELAHAEAVDAASP